MRERRKLLTEQDLIDRAERPRFNGWQNADSLEQWEREIDEWDAETVRRQMERQTSPPYQVTNRTVWVIGGGAVIGAILFYVYAFCRAIPDAVEKYWPR